MKEGAMKYKPAVNANYAVANSEPATAEAYSRVKSAAAVTAVEPATDVTTSTAVKSAAAMSATTAAGGKSVRTKSQATNAAEHENCGKGRALMRRMRVFSPRLRGPSADGREGVINPYGGTLF